MYEEKEELLRIKAENTGHHSMFIEEERKINQL